MSIEREPCDISAYFEAVGFDQWDQLWNEVLDWLHENHVDSKDFAQPISAYSLRAIFELLLALADPDYQSPNSDQSWLKFAEDDLFRALERISYPYPVALTALELSNPSEPSQWSRIVAIFYWLTVRGKVVSRCIIDDNLMIYKKYCTPILPGYNFLTSDNSDESGLDNPHLQGVMCRRPSHFVKARVRNHAINDLVLRWTSVTHHRDHPQPKPKPIVVASDDLVGSGGSYCIVWGVAARLFLLSGVAGRTLLASECLVSVSLLFRPGNRELYIRNNASYKL